MLDSLKAFTRRATALTLAAALTAPLSLGFAGDALADGRRIVGGGGVHAGRAMGGFGRGGFRHAGFARGGRGGFGRGFGGFDGGDFGGGRVGTGLAAASLALGVFGAVAAAAAEQQAEARPVCGLANQPVLHPNGTYTYRRIEVCQ